MEVKDGGYPSASSVNGRSFNSLSLTVKLTVSFF